MPEKVTNTEIDPFDTPCNDIDTSMPKLQPGRPYRMEIRRSTKAPVRTDTTREVLVLDLRTTQDAVSTEGKTIRAGYPLFDRIPLTPSAEMDAHAISKRISQVVKATELAKANPPVTPRVVMNDPSILEGKLVDVKTKINPEKDGYPESTGVSLYIPIP